MNRIWHVYYSFLTMRCVPTSKSQKLMLALSAQADAKKLVKLLNEDGFSHCNVVFKNATNMVIGCKA